MRERVTVVTLSVCQSVCHFSILEKAPFWGLKLTSVYIRGDDLTVTAVMYAGTSQSLNGLARDLLASEPFTKAVVCVVPELVSSLRLVAGFQTVFLSSK